MSVLPPVAVNPIWTSGSGKAEFTTGDASKAAEVGSRALSPAPSDTSTGRAGARSLISPLPPASPRRVVSPAHSEFSADWSDSGNLLSEKPKDIFEEDPGNSRGIFETWGYSATKEEWEDIMQKGSTGPYESLESASANLAVLQLAMKQLNPKLFWQTVHHLSPEGREEIKRFLTAANALLNSVED